METIKRVPVKCVPVKEVYKRCLEFRQEPSKAQVLILHPDITGTEDALYAALKSEEAKNRGIIPIIELNRREERLQGKTIVHLAYQDELDEALDFAIANNAKVIYLSQAISETDRPQVEEIHYFNPMMMNLGELRDELHQLKNGEAILVVKLYRHKGVSFVQTATNCGYDTKSSFFPRTQICTNDYGPMVKVNEFLKFTEKMDNTTLMDFGGGRHNFPIDIIADKQVVAIECMKPSQLVENILKP